MSAHGGGPRRVRRVMLYSHDTYGLGHLRRNLRIAEHLLRRGGGRVQVVLVSGSPVAGFFPAPPGLTVVGLPSVRKVGPEQYAPVRPGVSFSLVRRARSAVMVDVVRRVRPDLLLVDHSPAGMGGELLPVFEAVRRHAPATRVVLGLRDILDEPETVVRTWTEQGVYRLLEEVYDDVAVYGSPDVFDVGAAYRVPAAVRDRLVYCGYLGPTAPPRPAVTGTGGRYLLATAGGGADGAAVLAGAVEAGRSLRLETLVVSGPLVEAADYERLAAAAASAGPGVQLTRFHPDLAGAMAAAAALVTMGGYNTLTEAVATGVPTVVVPRSQPRLEQTIRARLFAGRGLVEMVPAGPALGTRIARAVAARLGRPPAEPGLDLGGLDRLADLVLRHPAGALPAPTAIRRPLLAAADERMPA